MSDGDDGKGNSPPGWYPYGETQWAWWDGEAFGPFAPRASSRPPSPQFLPYKPRMGKNATIPLVLLGLLLTGGLIAGLANLDYSRFEDLATVGKFKQAEVVDPIDGCGRIFEYFKALQQPGSMTNEEIVGRLRGLRAASRANDPQLADDVEDILKAADPTEVGAIFRRTLNRCVTLGALTQEQLAEVGVGPVETS